MQMYRISETGRKQLVKEFTGFTTVQPVDDRFVIKKNDAYKVVFPMKNGDIHVFDTSFRKHSVINLNQPISYLQQRDMDLDGEPELLVFDLVQNTLTILRNDFTCPATVKVGFGGLPHTTFSMKQDKDKPPMICMCTGDLLYLLSYGINPTWHARWGIWVAFWLALFLFTLLIRKTQKIQVEKRYATEKKITELQLKIVRNQMDPHFTMNAINAVVNAIDREEKEQAKDHLLHFSQMYRSLALSADKIKRPLREELDFTENYLALEQFRFGNRFTYKIEIDPGVDLTWEVPKMVIQSPVENAVKHGLQNKEAGGEIVIRARHEDRNLILEITDNGIGRPASGAEGTTSTGKGMEIMGQFFELYHKITGIRVRSTVADLMDESGKPLGTKVLVIIPLA
ncbi:MAG: histidine kinase [Bacteroidales bacterium]|nr:histidine kinase [Bacteroidales bacterium]